MFNNEDIKAYREISAPDGLRERVMTAARQTKKKPIILASTMRNIAAIAACFVFAVLVMIPMLAGGGAEIYFDGEKVGSKNISIAGENEGIMPIGARGLGLDLSFKLDTKDECYVAVSEGRVGDTRLSYAGPDARVAGDAELRWVIDLPDTQKTYFMTVENENESFTLGLVYGDSGWEIYRTDSSN